MIWLATDIKKEASIRSHHEPQPIPYYSILLP